MPFNRKIPNQLLYLAFVTVQEIMGANGLNSILNYAKLQKYVGHFPPNNLDVELDTKDFTRFIAGMINVIGENGARTIMQQCGKKSFEIMLKDFPSLFNLDGVNPNEASAEKKFDDYQRISGIILEAAKGIFGADIYKQEVTKEGLATEIAPCYWCEGLKSTGSICYAEVGFELGMSKWILGKETKIEETHCISRGDPMCRFLVHRPQ